MTIVVSTPTGHFGSHVVRLLHQAKVRTALPVRPGQVGRLHQIQGGRPTGRSGRCRLRARPTRDAHALFWVGPATSAPTTPIDVSARLGGHAADAVARERHPTVVFQSSIGAEHRHGAGLIDGLARVEGQLDAGGADVLHMRCGYYFTDLMPNLEALRAGMLPTTMSPETRLPWVTHATSVTSPRPACSPRVGPTVLCKAYPGRPI